MKKGLLISAVLSIIVFLTVGCGALNPANAINMGNSNNEEVRIEKDSAEELDVTVALGVGRLLVSGGADDWLSGELDYTSRHFKVDVDYTLQGATGKLAVEQKNNGKWNTIFGEQKNSWDLQLNDEIPLILHVKTGASNSTLDLKGLDLRKLTVDAGVGNLEVDLSGVWHTSFDAAVKTGVGETTIILPKEVGVKITATTGIGNTTFDGFTSQGNNVYVNEASETADVIINLNAETGVGKTNFILR